MTKTLKTLYMLDLCNTFLPKCADFSVNIEESDNGKLICEIEIDGEPVSDTVGESSTEPTQQTTTQSTCQLAAQQNVTPAIKYQWYNGNVLLDGETKPKLEQAQFMSGLTLTYVCEVTYQAPSWSRGVKFKSNAIKKCK